MKKFLIIASALAIAALSLTSCKEKFEPTYNVEIVGDADGDFTLTIPDGSLNLNGKAGIGFHYGNKADSTFRNSSAPTLRDALFSDDKELREAAEKLYVDYKSGFGAYAAKGTYYVRIYGIASAYGIEIKIDETFTNR